MLSPNLANTKEELGRLATAIPPFVELRWSLLLLVVVVIVVLLVVVAVIVSMHSTDTVFCYTFCLKQNFQ